MFPSVSRYVLAASLYYPLNNHCASLAPSNSSDARLNEHFTQRWNLGQSVDSMHMVSACLLNVTLFRSSQWILDESTKVICIILPPLTMNLGESRKMNLQTRLILPRKIFLKRERLERRPIKRGVTQPRTGQASLFYLHLICCEQPHVPDSYVGWYTFHFRFVTMWQLACLLLIIRP